MPKIRLKIRLLINHLYYIASAVECPILWYAYFNRLAHERLGRGRTVVETNWNILIRTIFIFYES